MLDYEECKRTAIDDAKPTGEAVLAASRGSLDGLNYALNIVRGRRVLKRTPDYLAAVDEMEIFLLAAIERVENGEPMSAVATVQ